MKNKTVRELRKRLKNLETHFEIEIGDKVISLANPVTKQDEKLRNDNIEIIVGHYKRFKNRYNYHLRKHDEYCYCSATRFFDFQFMLFDSTGSLRSPIVSEPYEVDPSTIDRSFTTCDYVNACKAAFALQKLRDPDNLKDVALCRPCKGKYV